jgi:hypothetical protein
MISRTKGRNTDMAKTRGDGKQRLEMEMLKRQDARHKSRARHGRLPKRHKRSRGRG